MVEQGMGGIVGPVQGKAHMALGKGVAAQAGEDAKDGDVRVLLDGLAQHGGVAFVGHVVQDDAGKAHFRLEGGHAGHDGGGGARHLGAVHGEHDWSAEQPRNVRRGAGSRNIAPIEKAAIAFDEGKVGRAACAYRSELAEKGFVVVEIGVKAGGRTACRKGQPCVVDIVRPFFAGLYGKAAAAEKTGEPQRNESFAASAGKPGNDESCLFHACSKVRFVKLEGLDTEKGKLPKELPP